MTRRNFAWHPVTLFWELILKTYSSNIHEESSVPAQLLHSQLQHSGLRDGPLVDVQSTLKMQKKN